MKGKLAFVLVVISTMIIFTASCIGMYNNKTVEPVEEITVQSICNSEMLNTINLLRREIVELEKENSLLDIKVEYLEERTECLNEILQEQMLIISSMDNKHFRRKYIVLPVYTSNIYTLEKEIQFYVAIPKNIKLEEKLNTLAGKLSKYCFRSLPIEVLGIEQIEGKKIAVVNLKELEESSEGVAALECIGKTWNAFYFQGSTGGAQTLIRLIETFLQRDYKGEWIDGVKFLYKNQTAEFDHVEGLFQINYR